VVYHSSSVIVVVAAVAILSAINVRRVYGCCNLRYFCIILHDMEAFAQNLARGLTLTFYIKLCHNIKQK